MADRTARILTYLFLAMFAVWAVANAYVGISVFGSGYLLAACATVVVLASITSSIRKRALEWRIAAFALLALIVAELCWRLLVSPLPENGFKVFAAAAYFSTPLIFLLGALASIFEWRRALADAE